MSDTPLTRDPSDYVIMVANDMVTAVTTLTSYGLGEQLKQDEPDLGVGVFVVTDAEEAYTASLIASQMRWCVVPEGIPSYSAKQYLHAIFGDASTIADALNVQNNEYAIDPRALRRAGA